MREPFRKARTVITVLLVSEICIGLLIISTTGLAHYVLGSYLASNERSALSSQFFTGYILGCQLVVTYMCSLAMWRRVWRRRCSPSVEMLLNMWMFFCFLIVLCGFGSIWTMITSGDGLAHTVEQALLRGIDLYYSCPEWKLLWDYLQYQRECCGVHGYRDWMKAKWMPLDELQPHNNNSCKSDQTEAQPQNDVVLAPYACCKHECNSCFQNYAPGGQSSSGSDSKIPDLNLTQINTCGCMPQFSVFLWKMLYALLALVLLAFKLDLIICGLTKIIIRKQNDGNDGVSNMGLTDDEGRPLVIVKCPPSVRCVTFDEDESSNQQSGGNFLPNFDDDEPRGQSRGKNRCDCWGRLRGGKEEQDHEMYNVRQERMRPRESRILH